MTRHWHFWVAVVAVLAGLATGLVALERSTSASGPRAVPGAQGPVPGAESPTPTSTPASAPPAPTGAVPSSVPTEAPTTAPTTEPTAAPTAPPTAAPTTAPTAVPVPEDPGPRTLPARAAGPPASSIHTSDRDVRKNKAKRVTWDTVLDDGKTMPGGGSRCAKAWRGSGKDAAIDWSYATHWCLASMKGTDFKPQGVGGSGTADGYQIGTRLAVDRNLVVVSSYSRSPEKKLLAPNSAGQSTTRMTVVDLESKKYNTVELVRRAGNGRFVTLNSHGSGLVWAGQYLYSSSYGTLWMYNADDLMKIRGRYVLPAVAQWRVTGQGGFSSISVTRFGGKNELNGINYETNGKTYIQRFRLDPTGLLADNPARDGHGLTVTNRFGEKGRTVHSVSSLSLTGSNYQGVGSSGEYTFANSSSLRLGGKGDVDATVVIRNGKIIGRLKMPHGNVESIYIDPRRGTFTSVTEAGEQFFFHLPVVQLAEAAES